jgi:bifunctional DNase/RNase
LRAVHLTEVRDGIFFANLIIGQGSEPEHKLSARPSDAIALALRTHSEILASTELLDEAGIEIPVEAGGDNQEVERFRQFLEEINPDDFAG